MPKAWLLAAVMTAAIVSLGGDAGARTGVDDRVAVVRGRGTLDGAPFDAPYLGAVVTRHGLVTPCQRSLPPVREGRFAVTVYSGADAKGCGAPGGEVYVWTFVRDQTIFSDQSVAWPGNGKTTRLRPTFSSATPTGGVGPIVGFAGEIFDRRGRRLGPGAEVEAYIDKTRCAVATTRIIDNFTGFSIDVVGPDAVPGCTLGATITFRVNGRLANETALNQPGQGDSLNLSLR